jgi:hypothetical protein
MGSMKNERQIKEYFKHARNEEPFIPFTHVKGFLEQKMIPQSSVKRFRPAVIWVPATVAFASLIFYFLILSLPDSPPVSKVAQPHPTPAIVSAEKGPTERKIEHGPSPVKKLRVTPMSSERKSPRNTTKPFTAPTRIDYPQAAHFASWSPPSIQPLRIYILDSVELSKIGIFVADDGVLRCWTGQTVLVREVTEGGSHTEAYARDSHGRIMDANLRKRFGPGVDQQIMITFSLVSDDKGCVIESGSGFGKKGPDLTQMLPFSNTPTHIDFCLDNLDPKFQKLVPIMIRTKHETRIYWMDPLPELLWRLPDWTQKELRDREERDRLRKFAGQKVHRGNDLHFSLRSGETREQNPAVELELNSRRNLAMALYDIQGHFVKELAPLQPLDKGFCEQEVDISDVSSGVYLFAIVTNNGEHSVQRICVP